MSPEELRQSIEEYTKVNATPAEMKEIRDKWAAEGLPNLLDAVERAWPTLKG